MERFMRYFNTAGPIDKGMHYYIEPLQRFDLDELLMLINQGKYFVLHAPRQTGKTTCLLSLRDYFNEEGKYFAVYINVEAAQACMHNVARGVKAIIGEIKKRMGMLVVTKDIIDGINDVYNEMDAESGLNMALTYLAKTIDKPLIFFIDEIDALIGDTLVSVLRQVRSGYDAKPNGFPSTIVLCGVRDVRDYRITSSLKEIVTGGSAFNIKATSLRLGNFSRDDVVNLSTKHTVTPGQRFEEDCYDLIMEYSDGQPWLVNALAYEVVVNMKENRDPAVVITPKMIEVAKERIILERQTHLDQLTDKLKEDRVRRVVLPMILGDDYIQNNEDDESYCIDLGIIKRDSKGLRISNKIYKEIIPRVLSHGPQNLFLNKYQKEVLWLNENGSINTKALFTLFRDFWIKNAGIQGESLSEYREATPQLVLQAFLQRVVNGNGYVNREYGLSRYRTDILVEWHYKVNGELTIQNIVIEIKVLRKNEKYETIKTEAIEQTLNYAQTCSVNKAHIMIFDRDNKQNWNSDEENEIVVVDDVEIEIWKLWQEEDL